MYSSRDVLPAALWILAVFKTMYHSLVPSERKSWTYHLIHGGPIYIFTMVCVILFVIGKQIFVGFPLKVLMSSATGGKLVFTAILGFMVELLVTYDLISSYQIYLPGSRTKYKFPKAIIEYCIDHNQGKSMALQRIMATNYYLRCIFNKQISDESMKEENEKFLNEVYESHSKLRDDPCPMAVNFKADKTIYDDLRRKETIQCMAIICYLGPLIYMLYNYCRIEENCKNITLMICLTNLYLILEGIHIKFCVVMYRIAKCCVAIFPHFSHHRVKFDIEFESEDDMIFGIEAIHYIMFGQLQDVRIILFNNDVLRKEILLIIAEYLYIPLPTVDSIDNFKYFLQFEDDHVRNMIIFN